MGKENQNRKEKQKHDTVSGGEDRFAAAETRPQFRQTKKNQSKVVLDERFASVLTDPRFQLQEKDKYGRRKKKNDAKEELSAFYTVEDEEAENETVKKEQKKERKDEDSSSNEAGSHSENPADDDDVQDDSSSSEEENEDPASRIAYLTAFSRGELDVSSSSDDDDSSKSSSDDEDEEADPVHGAAGVLDPSSKGEEEIEISYEDSPFLVVTNMDWDHIQARDLFSILSSFSPPGGVKSVQVFQSDFGMERMAKDKTHGPVGIWKKGKSARNNDDNGQDIGEDDGGSTNSESGKDSAEERSVNSDASGDPEDNEISLNIKSDHVESDFDPEKLREYEASKLKYYFAVVEFTSAENANIVYREVDGMEFEHSSAAIDLRTLPSEEVEGVTKNRPMRDQATSVPSNYEPPEFIVSALQQTKVQCTWDQGDVDRERKLTNYGSATWQEMAENDDLKAYLASDSSDEDSDDGKDKKGSKMRKMLGLDSGAESGASGEEGEDSEEEASSSDEEEHTKEVRYIPGAKSLEEKIRNKLHTNEDVKPEQTPWEKYIEKRKQKRKERRQASRQKQKGVEVDNGQDESDNDSSSGDERDDFFVDEGKGKRKEKKQSKGKTSILADQDQKGNEELELLFAGETKEEEARDFDIRGIQRMEKNKDKKLRGARKRKEEKLAADVSGSNFKVDVNDSRFAAVLEGADGRFGIDKTDPNYKETPAMQEILAEQTKRRKKKRRKVGSDSVVPDVSADNVVKTSGAAALSSLVKRLKSKVQ